MTPLPLFGWTEKNTKKRVEVTKHLRISPDNANEYLSLTLPSGITPLYQLLYGILNNPLDRTKITLVFGINTDADALFREQFSKYEKQFPDRFKVLYTVTNPSAGSQFHKGRITKELLKKVMAEDGERDTKFFVCGPPPMEE